MIDAQVILSFRHVCMTYFSAQDETQALLDVSFDVHSGEFVAVIGPSGCGKSTVLSLAAGLMPPASGEVRLLGKPVAGPSAKVGYMLQSDHLFPWRTIEKNAFLPIEIQGKCTKQAQQRVRSLLAQYGLSAFAKKHPRELSGGMRQRAALIRTLAAEPELLLLDEPFSALDAQTRLAVAEDLSGIMREQKKAVVLVTHDIAEAVSMADRILVFSGRPGRLVRDYPIDIPGSPLTRRNDPRFSDYFEVLWKELNGHDR